MKRSMAASKMVLLQNTAARTIRTASVMQHGKDNAAAPASIHLLFS